MQLDFMRLRLLLLAFLAPTFLCGGASAQVSTFAKTRPGIADNTSETQNMPAWTIATLGCDALKPNMPCPPALETRGSNVILPASSAMGKASSTRTDFAPDIKIDVTAQTTANSALFKVPVNTGDLTKKDDDGNEEPPAAASLEKLFQLSQTLDWRIEPGDMDGQNQVGVFTSRTLSQFGPNATFKFDTGINFEAKTGAVAGKAGFVVVW